MKKIIFGVFLALLIFNGCIQMPVAENASVVQSEAIKQVSETVESVTTGGSEEKQCEPSYSVTLPKDGKMGGNAAVSITATCAKGKTASVYLDGERVAWQTISTDETSEAAIAIPLKSDGAKTIEVRVDDSKVSGGELLVSPFGSDDTSGSKNNAFSIKEWIASGFETQSSMEVKSVGVYMRRLYSNTLKNSYVIVELRDDDGGEPGSSIIASAYKPIEETTMNERWIWFNFDDSAKLEKGKYWLVFRVDQENEALVSDVANIHYVGEDSTKPAGWNIRKMQLEWDDKEKKYLETSWEPLSYDRTYSILISSQEH